MSGAERGRRLLAPGFQCQIVGARQTPDGGQVRDGAESGAELAGEAGEVQGREERRRTVGETTSTSSFLRRPARVQPRAADWPPQPASRQSADATTSTHGTRPRPEHSVPLSHRPWAAGFSPRCSLAAAQPPRSSAWAAAAGPQAAASCQGAAEHFSAGAHRRPSAAQLGPAVPARTQAGPTGKYSIVYYSDINTGEQGTAYCAPL